ncbi:MAG: polysaccharide deacetylase family protein [Roseimicrobium sp.]
MNTDLDYIVIEETGEAVPAPAHIFSYARSHRTLTAAFGLALISIIALTSCYALKARPVDSIPRPKKDIKFQLGEKRPWLCDTPSATGKRGSSSGLQGKRFHLTFDDGPHPKHTPLILDWLKEHHLRATFFLVGEKVGRYPALVQRIVAEGHHVGNHTWSHPKLTVMSDAAVRDQIKRTHDAIVKACGQAPTVFRPPYGALSARQSVWIEKEFSYKTLLWDIDTLDWTQTTSTAIAARIEHGLKADSANIILAHDIHPRILPALESLLP